MPLTHDEALNLKPGDRLTLDGHELPFTVTEVRPLENGFQVYVVRDDWHGSDQLTYFEPKHLATVHPHIDPRLTDSAPSFLPAEEPDDEEASRKPTRSRRKDA